MVNTKRYLNIRVEGIMSKQVSRMLTDAGISHYGSIGMDGFETLDLAWPSRKIARFIKKLKGIDGVSVTYTVKQSKTY